MKTWKTHRLAYPLAATLLCTACLDLECVLRVRPNGHANLEVSAAIRKDTVGMYAALANPAGSPKETEGAFRNSLMSEFEKIGGKVFRGVYLARTEPIDSHDYEGVRAFFTIEDINNLTADVTTVNPLAEPATGRDEAIFSLEVGDGDNPTVLIVRFPEDSTETSEPAPESSRPEEDFEAFRRQFQALLLFFDGLEITVAIDVEGELISSTAPEVTDNRSTIIYFNLNKILDSLNISGESLPGEFPSQAELERLGAEGEIPGLIMPTDSEIRIEFR